MYLTGFLHRQMLFEITNRWLSGRLRQDDPLVITKIITYDSFTAWELLVAYMDRLLASLSGLPVRRKALTDKKQLKDFICNSMATSSDRVRTMIGKYRKMPEFYYVDSPFSGYVYFTESNSIIGISRFKRVKRIAEKASRYASIYLHDLVKQQGREILEKKTGKQVDENTLIPFEVLMTAEEQVMRRIKQQGLRLPLQQMAIKDVLGMKIIDTGYRESLLESAIMAYPGASILEKERHTGNYNAVHYVVELKADMDYILRRFNESSKYIDCSARGLPKKGMQKDFRKFLETGVETLQIDLIFTTYEELVESEIGRSMHETRIFQQRRQQAYFGNLPVNVEYIIEYLLAVALSPTTSLDDIPIKIWGRYLPDSLSYRIRKLYNMPEYALIAI
ncbi:MAG: hypothetical protein JRH18_14555 [Deltaproteobacteria bacterium]|nr:hypothetical protein [Deltaproteobacteria bacterium]